MISASNPHHNRGVLLLIFTTIVWGTSFPLLKHLLVSLTPASILIVRFAIAAIAFSPFLRRLNRNVIRDGLLLGIVYFVECVLALKGIETISANRSAFLVSLNVIFVPLMAVGLGRKLPLRVVLAAGLAIAGIGILSWEGGGIGVGDWLTLACAIGCAIYILLLEKVSPRHATLPLVAVQLATMAILGGIWATPQLMAQMGAIADNFQILLYMSLIVTATPILTQAIAQRDVSSHEAALLYTLEPVFASIFSFWLLGEQLGVRGLIGAGLILFATVWSQRKINPQEL
ncbi:DMT family transporter [Microcoleus sp. FACHB-1515]|uniref:DMT family transporter n=1 Tax=Cyanophyceae TaxID=3028117 RepID=UPI001682A6C1|nr:DMT family transporter [Microcoleus sp. FACHB-1515]MBD2090968.1 DMT family transporter [Microcoleus sp. FACHB-1515]